MKSYQAYLFDFDYTLANSSKGIVMCYRNVLERHGFHQVDDLSIKRTIGKTLVDSFSIMTGITDADNAWRHSEKNIVQGSRPAHDGQYRTFPETEEVYAP